MNQPIELKLPTNWCASELGALIRSIEAGRSPSAHSYPPVSNEPAVLKVSAVSWGIFDPTASKVLKDGDVIGDTPTVRKGDLLISRANTVELVGAAVVSNANHPNLMLSDKTLRINPIPELVDSNYLLYSLRTRAVREVFESDATGTSNSMRNITQAKIKSAPILLPPRDEQTRIVSAIESLQERSSRTRALLEEVKPLIAQLRQSVLRSAFSGRLTADWRAKQNTSDLKGKEEGPGASTNAKAGAAGKPTAQKADNTGSSPQSTETKFETATELLQRIRTERRKNWEAAQLAAFEAKGKNPTKGWQGKYEESEPVDESELPELPNGWCWIFLPEVGYMNRGKSRHRPRNAEQLYGGPYPFVQTGDVSNSDGYVATHTQTYSEEGLKQSQLWPEGTVCITIAANIASSAVLTYPACFPDSVVGVLPDSEVCSAEYVELFIRTAKEDLERFAPSTAQKNINLRTLSSLAIPIPPRAESEEIVKILTNAMGMAKSVGDASDSMEDSLTQLDQSILSKAFRGELVPQDPNDEPASELLARIRGSREAEAETKKAAKKKAKKKSSRKPKL